MRENMRDMGFATEPSSSKPFPGNPGLESPSGTISQRINYRAANRTNIVELTIAGIQ
jgi:hypothetical protein